MRGLIYLGILMLIYFSAACTTDTSELQSELEKLRSEKSSLESELAQQKQSLSEMESSMKLLEKDSEVLEAYKNYQEKSVLSQRKINTLDDSISNIDSSKDYSTCTQYVDKHEELHELFRIDEDLDTDYLMSVYAVYNSTECFDLISAHKAQQSDTNLLRSKYRSELSNWCTGFHGVDYDSAWDEKYFTPLELAVNNLDQAETDLGESLVAATLGCFD